MKTLVIIVTLIGLSAVVGAIIVGSMVFEGKVVDKPYETGLRYDEIEKLKLEIRLELLNKRLYTGKNEIIFILTDNLNKPITDNRLSLMISRTSTTLYDREYRISPVEPGRYRAVVDFPFYGYWAIKVGLIRNGIPLILEKRVYVNKDQS